MEVTCSCCGISINKPPSQCRSAKGLNFCSLSCSVSYNNKHKEVGIRRSKIELWLETRIKEKFKGLEVHYNKHDAIGSELDIFIPSLNLAIEINGPTHYKPVFGQAILESTQRNDEEKRKLCKEKNIELYEIDVSKLKTFKRSMELLRIVESVFAKISSKIITINPSKL